MPWAWREDVEDETAGLLTPCPVMLVLVMLILALGTCIAGLATMGSKLCLARLGSRPDWTWLDLAFSLVAVGTRILTYLPPRFVDWGCFC
jgi:hypothetical protein